LPAAGGGVCAMAEPTMPRANNANRCFFINFSKSYNNNKTGESNTFVTQYPNPFI
jgi:hypothetical protein